MAAWWATVVCGLRVVHGRDPSQWLSACCASITRTGRRWWTLFHAAHLALHMALPWRTYPDRLASNTVIHVIISCQNQRVPVSTTSGTFQSAAQTPS